jgi:hypothetical protein
MAPPTYVRRAGRAGLALYAAAAALLAASFVLVAALRADYMVGWAVFATFPLALWLYARARRFRVRIFASDQDLHRYLDERGEKLILFLREFASDGAPLREIDDSLADIFITEEERIAGTLGAYGTVVAIGQPGEPLPAAGSCRLYVEANHWREVVGRLLDRADLVVLRPGVSTGISWELDQIVARERAERTILVPTADLARNTAAYERLRALFPEPPDPMAAQVERITALDMPDEQKRKIREMYANLAAMNRVMDQLSVVPKLAPALFRLRAGRLERSKGTLQEALEAVAREFKLRMRGAAKLKLALMLALVFGPLLVLASHFLACPLLSPSGCVIYKEITGWVFMVSTVAMLALAAMLV